MKTKMRIPAQTKVSNVPTNLQVKPFQCVTPEAAPLTCNAVTFAIPAQ